MNFLFWNTKKNPNIHTFLESLIESFDCDLVALAEYEGNSHHLLSRLKELGLNYYYVTQIGCRRIDLFVKFHPDHIEHYIETDYYTIKKLPHPTHGFVMAAFVHFPSQMHKNEKDRLSGAIRFREDLEESERNANISKTFVLGDFNSNPFDSAMLNADALHSVPSRQIASAQTRTVERRERKMFYNPMWNFFGDIFHPPGTYYYRSTGYESVFWNIFDQVIVRPDLMEFLDPQNIKIVTKANGASLLDTRGLPNQELASDHLPLFFKIS